jgi:hypothetical protein
VIRENIHVRPHRGLGRGSGHCARAPGVCRAVRGAAALAPARRHPNPFCHPAASSARCRDRKLMIVPLPGDGFSRPDTLSRLSMSFSGLNTLCFATAPRRVRSPSPGFSQVPPPPRGFDGPKHARSGYLWETASAFVCRTCAKEAGPRLNHRWVGARDLGPRRALRQLGGSEGVTVHASTVVGTTEQRAHANVPPERPKVGNQHPDLCEN